MLRWFRKLLNWLRKSSNWLREQYEDNNFTGCIKLLLRFAIIAISIVAIWTTYKAYKKEFIDPGELKVFTPRSFCIKRGDKNNGFPSDHIIVPFIFENTGIGTKTVEFATLALTRLPKEVSSLESKNAKPLESISSLKKPRMTRA